MTTNQLNAFIRACVEDGRPEALVLAREAAQRLKDRA